MAGASERGQPSGSVAIAGIAKRPRGASRVVTVARVAPGEIRAQGPAPGSLLFAGASAGSDGTNPCSTGAGTPSSVTTTEPVVSSRIWVGTSASTATADATSTESRSASGGSATAISLLSLLAGSARSRAAVAAPLLRPRPPARTGRAPRLESRWFRQGRRGRRRWGGGFWPHGRRTSARRRRHPSRPAPRLRDTGRPQAPLSLNECASMHLNSRRQRPRWCKEAPNNASPYGS
jgi:hypothetical protein